MPDLNPKHIEAHRLWATRSGGQQLILDSADLRGADLRDALLDGAFLLNCDMREADLEGADLSRAWLAGTNLDGANMTRADLMKTDLTGASLAGATLRQARCARTDFERAVLHGADLRESHLFLTRFAGSDLVSADLTGALMGAANVDEAVFGNIRMQDCKGSVSPENGTVTFVGDDESILSVPKFVDLANARGSFLTVHESGTRPTLPPPWPWMQTDR